MKSSSKTTKNEQSKQQPKDKKTNANDKKMNQKQTTTTTRQSMNEEIDEMRSRITMLKEMNDISSDETDELSKTSMNVLKNRERDESMEQQSSFVFACVVLCFCMFC